ncbi:uncharacterized protein LOC134182576 isoform X1 [Corticium candelabrum]|uniref:uncharacterized protein LOC134182576 isoform X1 n=1 Tax=Corticium candelabrum TaxID=121492 RepID=UPI002E26C9C1|nr:uncharacterized protein LOC134182576 isoform X1 [Corticium candelabrum]
MNSVVVDRNYSRLQRRRTVVYVFLCVICELLGLGLVFLQLYGAHRIDERYRFWMSSSFGKSMRRYAFCLPLSTGLLLILNSSLAILVQWIHDRKPSTWIKTLVGPWWILTATVAIVTFVIATIETSNFGTTEMWATASLALVAAVISYVQSCIAFFAGHACCYCTRNDSHFQRDYSEVQFVQRNF